MTVTNNSPWLKVNTIWASTGQQVIKILSTLDQHFVYTLMTPEPLHAIVGKSIDLQLSLSKLML